MASRHHKDTITHWLVTGSDGFGGFTYDTPTTLLGRWEERQELFVDENGEQAVSRAIAYTALGLDLGDFIALGDYSDDASPVASANRIRSISKISNLRNVSTEHKVIM